MRGRSGHHSSRVQLARKANRRVVEEFRSSLAAQDRQIRKAGHA